MNEKCPYNDECGILSSCDETCCRVKELFDDYYKLEKLYFEKEEENKKLKEWEEANKPTGICETCTANCVLENDKLRIENRKLKQTAMTICPQCGEVYLTPEGSKLYEENEELKKQLQQSTKDFCKSCSEDCALENTEMIQKLKRLCNEEKHKRYQAEAKLDKLRPILRYYQDSHIGELQPDGTYRCEIEYVKENNFYGYTTLSDETGPIHSNVITYDPGPAKEGLEIIESREVKNETEYWKHQAELGSETCDRLDNQLKHITELHDKLYAELNKIVEPRLLTDSCGYNEETHSFDIILALKEILEYLENEK